MVITSSNSSQEDPIAAGVFPRVFAFAIDLLIFLAVLYFAVQNRSKTLYQLYHLGLPAYFIICEALWGMSLGKKLFRLRVANNSWFSVIARNAGFSVMGIAGIYNYSYKNYLVGVFNLGVFALIIISLLAILLTKKRQSLFDLLANTRVVKDLKI